MCKFCQCYEAVNCGTECFVSADPTPATLHLLTNHFHDTQEHKLPVQKIKINILQVQDCKVA